MKKHIPNTITCCNLICGCLAVGAAFHSHFVWATIMIFAGAVFDFFDGMLARLLRVSSPIGKELDSLADCITFGLAPSAMLFQMIGLSLEHTPWAQLLPAALVSSVPYLAFVMAAFSALRLAKFNLDERQQYGFIGLPTPANALFWCGLALSETYLFLSATSYLLLCLAMSLLLVAEIPLFALKFKSLAWRDNAVKYVFLLGSLLLILTLKAAAAAAIVIWYVLLSLLTNALQARTHQQ